jgi:hypothetical protein
MGAFVGPTTVPTIENGPAPTTSVDALVRVFSAVLPGALVSHAVASTRRSAHKGARPIRLMLQTIVLILIHLCWNGIPALVSAWE